MIGLGGAALPSGHRGPPDRLLPPRLVAGRSKEERAVPCLDSLFPLKHVPFPFLGNSGKDSMIPDG